MLLELDDDSLHMICDYLELKDLLVLTMVCKDLQNFIEDRFRRTCKKISFFTEFWLTEENEIYMPAFLKVTAGTVENMEIMGNAIMANKNWLERLTFEKVTVLNISLRKLTYEIEEVLPFAAKLFPNVVKILTYGKKLDDAIGMIADLLPNIKKMKLYGPCTGINLVKMANLHTLYVHTHSHIFDGKLLSQFSRAPKLKSLTYLRFYGLPKRLDSVNYVENLQELTILNSDYENLIKAEVFRAMKNLRKITTDEYPLYYTLSLEDKHFYRQIDGFSISRRYTTDMKLIVNAPKLRRLWSNRENDILPDFCNEQAKSFKNLEELYFIFSRAGKEPQQSVMTVVSRSPKLRLLDISGTKFNVGFVENLINILKWKQRTHELVLRCHNTRISNDDLRCLDLPKHLKVSFENVEYDLPKKNIINFQIYLRDQPPDEEKIFFI